jgi:hypothetical protein
MLEDEALKVNSLNGDPFPVTIAYSENENLFRVYLTPLSVAEMADLLPETSFLVFNVDTNEFDESGSVTLSQAADRYSNFVKKFDDEILLMGKEQVIQLLLNVGHYNFNLIALEESIDVDKVLQVLDLAKRFGETTVVDKVGSQLYLNSHDDCYLYLETNDRTLAEKLISLQIRTLIGVYLAISPDELTFSSGDLIKNCPLSIVIPQVAEEKGGRVFWQILDGTFKDYVYGQNLRESGLKLVLSGTGVQIEKVRSDESPD